MAALRRVVVRFAIPEIYLELGISTATFYRWRAKFGGMSSSNLSEASERWNPLASFQTHEHDSLTCCTKVCTTWHRPES